MTIFSGNLGDGTTRTYSTGAVYSSLGSLLKEQFGTNTPVYHKVHYNSRAQICDVRASTVNDEWGGELGALVNYYSYPFAHCGNGPDNNGNVLMSQTIINSVYFEDRYSYDSLNRLTAVDEYLNGATFSGTQQYDYDRWGNRSLKPASTLGTYKEFTVNTTKNQLGVPASQPPSVAMNYDNAGNLTNDTYTGAGNRTYDAENRITSAWGGNNQAQLYRYDAIGQRIKRTVDGVTTWQVYGMGGELLAEYPANGTATSPQKEYGYRNGQLLVTASAGSRVNFARSTNGATATAQNYTQDGVFAGYHFYPSSAIDGQRYGHLIAGGGDINGFWRDEHGLPSWLEINFNGSKTIEEIDVFTIPECPTCLTQADPSPTQTFSQYGVTGFQVQYWTGSTWATVPGGSISSNNLVWRKLTFAAITTSKIRVTVTAAATDGVARIAEIEAWTTSQGNNATVNWLVNDHLGTPRMIIDQTGTLANVKRHDYLPFGEELFAPAGGRSTSLGYAAGDGVRQQFTDKERDVETGLDYFRARYYSPLQGRFTSPDTFGGTQLNPQSLNLYSYVQNDPLRYVDPSGHAPFDPSLDPYNCPLCQDLQTPTQTKPSVSVPEGFEIKEDGSLAKKGGGAVIRETVEVTAKRGIFSRIFGTVRRAFTRGPIGGAATVFVGEMIDPESVGGGDADLGEKELGFALNMQHTFMERRFTPERLQEDRVFYRVFSDPARMKGGFLTEQYFQSSSMAIKMLALSPEVTGNKATHIVAVVVPAGTIIARGLAAPQDPRDKYPGGGSQVMIPMPQDPRIQWVNPHRIGP